MNKSIKILTLLLTLFLLSFVLLYNTFSLFSNSKSRIEKAESILPPYRSHLFQKINLNYPSEKIDFTDIDNRLKVSLDSYIGYELTLAGDSLFSTESMQSVQKYHWKREKVTSQALINRCGYLAQLIFTNNNTGHQFKVIIKLVDQPFLLGLLIVNAIALSFYLFFLLILLITLFFYNKKNSEKATLSDFPLESLEGDFLFSEMGYEKYKGYIQQAFETQNDFSVALIKNDRHPFDEKENPTGFALIQTHIKLNHGYYEFEEHQMMVLLPNTQLKEAIRLIEEFFARYIEENIDIALSGGLSTLNGREVSATLLTREAQRALEKAKEKSENQILGFDPNPLQFKRYIEKNKEDR